MTDLDPIEREAIDASFDRCQPDDFAMAGSQAEGRLGDRLDELHDVTLQAVLGDLFKGSHISAEHRHIIRDALLVSSCYGQIGVLPRLLNRWYGHL